MLTGRFLHSNSIDLCFSNAFTSRLMKGYVCLFQWLWNYFFFSLGNVTTNQLVLTSRGLVGITREGKLFHFSFVGEQKILVFPKLDGMVFSELSCSIDGSSLVGLDRNGSTFVHWEFHHNHVTFEQPYEIIRLKEPCPEITKIVAGKSHFMFLTNTGDVYRWSFGTSSTLTRMSNSLQYLDLTFWN